jgi:hypothetical protein
MSVKYSGCGPPVRMVTLRPTRTPLRGFRELTGASLSLSESIDTGLPPPPSPTLAAASIGCVLPSDEACIVVIERLVALGIAPNEIHVGATSTSRAALIAQQTQAIADIAPEDPFRDLPRYSGGDKVRLVVDKAGVWGGLIGAVAGLLIGRQPALNLLPVAPSLEPLASVLFFFVTGLFLGSILGAALAPQQSSHAAFRLIDGMQDGGVALIVGIPPGRQAELTKVLEAAGATGLTQL